MSKWDWFGFRMLRVFSPLPLIAGLAAFVQGWVAAGVVLVIMSALMYGFGRRAPRQPPV
jgi:hypothetical protein